MTNIVLFTQIYFGGGTRLREEGMGEACSTHGPNVKCIYVYTFSMETQIEDVT
jgi:hypothetical protein